MDLAAIAAFNAAQDRAKDAYYGTRDPALALAKAARKAEAQRRYRIRLKEQR